MEELTEPWVSQEACGGAKRAFPSRDTLHTSRVSSVLEQGKYSQWVLCLENLLRGLFLLVKGGCGLMHISLGEFFVWDSEDSSPLLWTVS